MSEALSVAVTIRDATKADLPAVLAIYNQVLLTSAAIWRDEPVALAERTAWFQAQDDQDFPVLVAVDGNDNDETGPVVGFASFGAFRPWPGYYPTVEHSIHVADGKRGAGIGQLLLDALIGRAKAMGKSVMIAGIDAGNVGSIRFHERAGFREVARMTGIGRKFGEPVDLVLFQHDLTSEAETDPAAGS